MLATGYFRYLPTILGKKRETEPWKTSQVDLTRIEILERSSNLPSLVGLDVWPYNLDNYSDYMYICHKSAFGWVYTYKSSVSSWDVKQKLAKKWGNFLEPRNPTWFTWKSPHFWEKKKTSEPNLHDFGFQPLIFQGALILSTVDRSTSPCWRNWIRCTSCQGGVGCWDAQVPLWLWGGSHF